MGYTVSFLYNEIYGASHINKITERLIGKGINPAYVDGEFYDTTDLDKITDMISTEGIMYNAHSCRVVVSDSSHLKILAGSAIFYDGAAIDVDSSGIEMSILEGHNYVYFKYDIQTKTITPVISNTAPGTYDIPLAEYSEGVLTDKRNFAVSKIEGFGTNTYQDVSSEVNGTYVLTEKDPTWNCVKKIPLVRTDFKYIMINVTSKAREITGGFFGIRNGANFLWTGGCFHDYHARAMSNNDCIDTAGDAQKGVLVETGWSKSDYVLIDFDITAGNLQVYLKPPSARTFTLSDVSVILC